MGAANPQLPITSRQSPARPGPLLRFAAWLKVRPGEGRTVALAVALMLAAYSGFGLGGSAVEALLFARAGVALLPGLFMALAALNLLLSLALTALLGRAPQHSVYLALPLALAAMLGLERALLLFDFAWLYPAMWLSMMAAFTLHGHFTWGLAGAGLDARQVKRLFPLIGAGSILGTALGGGLTPFLVGALGSENLLLVWAALLLLAYGLGRALRAGAPPPEPPARAPRPERMSRQLLQGFQYVRRSPLFIWLSLATVAYSLLFYSLAFPFAREAAAAFPDEDVLAGFIGLVQGVCTGAAFVLSLLVANRAYARLGLSNAILVNALIYFAGFAGLAALTLAGMGSAPGAAGLPLALLFLLGFRFLQQSWLQGVAGPAYQALLNVAPPARRGQVRAFIEGVPVQGGTLLAGAVLLVGEQALRPEHLYLVGLAGALLGIYTMRRVALAYAGALLDALRAGYRQVFYEEDEPFGGFVRDAAAVKAVVDGLAHPEPAVRRVAAETLGQLPAPGADEALARALADADPQVRAGALRALGRAGAAPAMLDVALCLADPAPEVRLQAVETLARLAAHPRGLQAQLRPLLADPEPLVRAQAALELLRLGPDQQARDLLRSMAMLGDAPERVCALRALGEWGDREAYPLAAGEAQDLGAPSAARRAAARALPQIDPGRAVADLVHLLGDDDAGVRAAAAEALGRIGPPALDPVVFALFDSRLEGGALLALRGLPAADAGSALLAFNKMALARALRYHDLWRRLEARETVAGLPRADERVRLLADALRDRALLHARAALGAVGLLAGPADMDLTLAGLAARDPAQRANAVETLEALNGRWREHVRPLLPLWDPHEAAPEPAAPGLPDPAPDLLHDPDEWVRACAALALGPLAARDEAVREALARLAQDDPDKFVRAAAGETARDAVGGPAMHTLATLSVMERILFLRRVPLFAELDPADLKQAAAAMEEQLYADGETIARAGEAGGELYIIASGAVRVLAAGGAQLARRAAGEYVGEMALISREPRMATLVAEGETRLLVFQCAAFDELLRERPEAALAVMRVLIARLKEAQGEGE